MIVGYHASHEQFTPRDLVEYAMLAEDCGFDAVMSSDHFAPWSEAQGCSGFAWSWLGAAMQATSLPFGLITVPIGFRYHPAISAQAAATIGNLFPGRFPWLAVGSGELLNEHIVGQGWPDKSCRNERLSNAVSVMRNLWNGETVTQDKPIKIDEARLYVLPERPPQIIAAVLSVKTARWAGEWADGIITVNQPLSALDDILHAFDAGGGRGKPRFIQVHLAYSSSFGQARHMAFRQWKSNLIDADTAENTRLTSDFDAKARHATIGNLDEHVLVSSDSGLHVEMIQTYQNLGFTEIYLHNVAENQREFIKEFGNKIIKQIL